jgi:hypothetical protein
MSTFVIPGLQQNKPGMEKEKVMVLPSDWRSPACAEEYANHDFADFAQEFLRRNPAYQSDCKKVEQNPPNDDEPGAQNAVAHKWGLLFRRRPYPRPTRRACIVATGGEPRRSYAYPSQRTIFGPAAFARSSLPVRNRAPAT